MTVHLGEHNGVEQAVRPQLVSQRTLLAEAVLLVGHSHNHYLRVSLQASHVLLRRRAELQHEELHLCLHSTHERRSVVREDRVGVRLAGVGVEVDDVFLSVAAVLGQISTAIDVVGGHIGVELHALCVVVLSKRSNHDGRVRAADASCSACLATLGAHPREVLRLGSGHEGVSGTLRDIVDEVACDGYLRLRLLAQTHADGVADAVGKQCADAHRTLDASVFALASLGHAEVERIVHVSLVHLGDEQAHGAHHDDGVRCLDAYHYVVELLLLADAQKLHAALDDAFRRVAVARHDAVGERTVVHADAHRGVVFAADVEEGHEAVLQLLQLVGILGIGVLNLLEHTRRVDVVAWVHAHLLGVQRSHVSHVGVEVYVGYERCLIAVGT